MGQAALQQSIYATPAQPFLKWAGGKTQLIGEIERVLPNNLMDSDFTYVEPFVGSGAVLFWMLRTFPNLKKAIINDVNTDLINTYKTIRDEPQKLIQLLGNYQSDYHGLAHFPEKKKEYYYQKRTLYNSSVASNTEQSALFIFLNRTCFNGLYRVNRKNEFNVPIGSYKTPTICNAENILAVSNALQNVEILNGDFEETFNHVSEPSLFYFDPPYKPLSSTSSFNSYAKEEFDDTEQTRLRDFCKSLNEQGHKWILSNSDVKGKNPEDDFFDDLYADFNIKRVSAKRSINANPKKRGTLSELLITN